MPQYRYSPFTTALDNVTGADLLRLKEVAEGWFVEYKSLAFDA